MRTLPQVTGPTEHTLGVLLDRELASSRVPDYLAWVCLNFSGAARDRSSLQAHLDQETKCGRERAAGTIERLIALGLLDSNAQPSPGGQAELTSVRKRVKTITDQLVIGVSEDDLATTIRVLDHVRHRAQAILES